MTEEKPPNSEVDVERQAAIIALNAGNESNESEPLEKSKEKVPPVTDASVVILYAVCFAMFTIGWVNLNSCNTSRFIPIYLIVAGFTGAVFKFISKTTNRHLFNVLIAVAIFYFTWHGIGSYWVYKEYQPEYYDTKSKNYCDRTTFLLAFWVITLQYVFVGFMLMLTGCYMMMKGDFKKK